MAWFKSVRLVVLVVLCSVIYWEANCQFIDGNCCASFSVSDNTDLMVWGFFNPGEFEIEEAKFQNAFLLEVAYRTFRDDGYTGSFEDYVEVILYHPEATEYAIVCLRNEGLNLTTQDLLRFMGFDKQSVSVTSHRLPGVTNVSSISAGEFHVLALDETGRIHAFGDNESGQCELPEGEIRFKSVAAGRDHSIGLTRSGEVLCWGDNSSGQCVVPDFDLEVSKIAAGQSSSFCLLNDGRLVSWGAGEVVSDFDPNRKLRDIKVGYRHAIGIGLADEVVAWGDNDYLQCEVPQNLGPVVKVAAGREHSLALTYRGEVVGWGRNSHGQISIPTFDTTVVDIAAGHYHSIAQLIDGRVVAWGYNETEQTVISSTFRSKALAPQVFGFRPAVYAVDESRMVIEERPSIQGLNNGEVNPLDTLFVRVPLLNRGDVKGRNLSSNWRFRDGQDAVQSIAQTGLFDLDPGQEQMVELKIVASTNLASSDSISFEWDVVDAQGWGPPTMYVKLGVQQNGNSSIFADVQSSKVVWTSGRVMDAKLILTNEGDFPFPESSVSLMFPDGMSLYSGEQVEDIEALWPGQSVEMTYEFLIPRSFNRDSVEIDFRLDELTTGYSKELGRKFAFAEGFVGGPIIGLSGSDSLRSGEGEHQIGNKLDWLQDVTFNQVDKDVEVSTIAVVPVDGLMCDGRVASGQEVASLAESNLLGFYKVVERRLLEQILKEQRLALTGLLYEKQAVEAGCNIGAQGIVFTEYGCINNLPSVQVKLVDCETSELYWSATGVNVNPVVLMNKIKESLGDGN